MGYCYVMHIHIANIRFNLQFIYRGNSKMKIQFYSLGLCMHVQRTRWPPSRRSHKGIASTVNLTLDRAPGTHHCWVARGSVDSKLAQGLCTYDRHYENRTRDPYISGPMPYPVLNTLDYSSRACGPVYVKYY